MEKDYEKTWNDFWEEPCTTDGVVDIDKIKRELYDYRTLWNNASRVYDHVTGGLISKANTLPEIVMPAADADRFRIFEEWRKEQAEILVEVLTPRRTISTREFLEDLINAGGLPVDFDIEAAIKRINE